MTKFGYVAVVGYPNAGKSSLVNSLVGEKVSIVSNKPQTTRDNILGIYTDENTQIVFIDTPGIHLSKNKLDQCMNRNVKMAKNSADVLLYVIDATKKNIDSDVEFLTDIKNKFELPKIVVAVNKIDIAKPQDVLNLFAKIGQIANFELINISARTSKNCDELLKIIIDKLPSVESNACFQFGKDDYTDKSVNFLIAESVREQVLRKIDQEIPYGVACVVSKFEESEKIVFVDVDIFCEKDSHKNIIIGKGGSKLKEIGVFAREEIEKILNKTVMLNLWVKVKRNWRIDENFLSEIGYRLY